MGLFSDLDWVIIAGVAAFLLFGRGSGETMRMIGRWYARATRLKQELLTEFSKAADLPPQALGAPVSIRSTLLGLEPGPGRASGIPAAVRVAPTAPPAPPTPNYPPSTPWTGGTPVPTWSATSDLGYSSTQGVR
jgi:hypothetical protein